MLTQEEIPQELLSELASYYKTISFENYGNPITDNVQSRASRYARTVEENVEAMALDPETFETKLTQGNVVESFIVRGIFKEDSADVYMVLAGKALVANKNREGDL